MSKEERRYKLSQYDEKTGAFFDDIVRDWDLNRCVTVRKELKKVNNTVGAFWILVSGVIALCTFIVILITNFETLISGDKLGPEFVILFIYWLLPLFLYLGGELIFNRFLSAIQRRINTIGGLQE